MKETIPSPLRGLYSTSYTLEEVEQIYQVLCDRGVFDFEMFSTGLFPAVGSGSPTERTSGYRAAWVRDNVHIAYAHFIAEDFISACRNALALASFFEKHRNRFTDIIAKKKDARDPMNRPHIRFNGETGKEINEKWPHAQNDALGYFLWFFCTLALQGTVKVTAAHKALLADFVRYFKAIEYWKDEDSGHWEEQRKVSASSIGVVNAGIKKYRELLDSPPFASGEALHKRDVDELLTVGIHAMNTILPFECIQNDPLKHRRYDAALLFLIDPLHIVGPDTADQIVSDIVSTLQGEHGIVRYPEDSYWGPDYRNIPEEKRTIDLSDDIIQRSDFSAAGMEAQWCIFDSVLSIAYGKKFQQSRDWRYLALQTEYWNRSLSQLVESPNDKRRLLVPEAYFMENGRYVPNDHLPLQWAQANLLRSFHCMVDSLKNVPT